MPGKHAPASPKSFLISLGTAIGGAVLALVVVVVMAMVLLNAGSEEPQGRPSTNTTPTDTAPTPTESVSPTATATATATSTAPSGDTTPVEQTTIRVLNGSGRPGVAAQMADRAKREGYPDPKIGNTTRTAKSTVYYADGARDEAEEFQRRFPEFTEIAQAPSTFGKDVLLTVVIGLDYPSSSPSASPSS